MPTNFGTGFGPSFGMTGWNNQPWNNQQLTKPTKQQKFPGLNDEQIKRLESISSDPQRQQELYKQAIQQLNSQNVKDNRIATENEMAYRNLNQKDVRQKNYTDSQIRLEQLADLTKEKFGLRQDAPTQEVVNGVIAMAQDKGVSLDEMNAYLDTGDQNFLYNLELKENPKEKLRENAWDNIWDNIRTKANVPIDTMKKRGKRTFNEASEKIYKGILKNFVGDSVLGEMGINLDDYVDTVTDKTVTPALQQDTLNYQNEINERYRALEQKNLDQDIKNYYDNKGYTKLLKEGDFKGFLYKSMGDAAQNWEMPVVIAASVFQPEIGMALMTTDAYARENQEAFENMMNNGATYEQAEQGAVAVGLVNAAVEVTLEKLLGGVETSASSAIRKTFMKNVQEEAAKKGLGRILLEGAGTQLRSSTEEGLEEIVQQIVQNAAVKTVNENQKLFEGVGSAFEGGFYNPMNLLAGGGNINQNIQANKSEIRQSIMDTATTATTQSRDLLDAISDKAQDMGDTAKNKVSGLVDQTYGIDETLRKDIQDNPYSAQVWARTKNYIEENGRPEKSNDVAKALITDVADRVQESLMDKMEEGSEAGRLYKPLLDAGYSVDLSELKDGIDDMLEKYGIKIEDGKLNFDKTAIDGSEANNIRKIYNWIKDTNKPMSLDEYKNRFRKTMSDMVDFNQVGRDQAGRKKADTQGDIVLKGIRSFANDLAHNQIPELAAVDKKFNEWVEVMDEVSDGLVYKDKAKRGVIRDNISQIIKNLDTPNRRELANRLEKIMPGITEEVRAINKMPQLIDHYYKPSGLQQTLTSSAGAAVGGAIGGIPGGILGAGAGYLASKWIDKFKSAKWDKIISETSEDGKAKLNDIQARIENNEKISQEQKAFLEEMSNKLKEGKADKEAEVAKIIAEVSSAEGDVETALNNAIDRLETLGAKQEVKEMRQLLGQVQNQKAEDAQMEQARQEFEAEKENIINESADQRLPEFKERIYKLQQEEKRIGSVAGKKIGKTFEGKDYKNQQETEWLRKKDKLIEEIGEYYNVDQFEAAEIYDRIERQASADDLGFNGKPASSKTAKYQVADDLESQYETAVKNGDEARAKEILKEYAESKGYKGTEDYKGRGAWAAPSSSVEKADFRNLEKIGEALEDGGESNLYGVANGYSAMPVDMLERENTWRYFRTNTEREAYYPIREAMDDIQRQMKEYGEVKDMPKVTVYRAVPDYSKSIKKLQSDIDKFIIGEDGKPHINGSLSQLSKDALESYDYYADMYKKYGGTTPEENLYERLTNDRDYKDSLSVKEGMLESGGEWVTPSKQYAKDHGNNRFDGEYKIIKDEIPADQLWWDGNAIEEWGFDDGNEYAVKKGTKNSRKNLEIEYDDKGNLIPLSKRFNEKKADPRYQKYGIAGEGEKGVSATEGLNIRNFKNGKTVQELANQYGIDTKIVDSISTPEGQRAYGMYGDRLITLSKDLKESTVPHELLHGVFDMVDGKRKTSILEGIQKKLNVDNVQAEEWLADNFSEYYRTGKFGTKGLAKGLVEKVKQFFYEVKSYIDGTYKNEKQIRQLFDDIIDGKIEGEYGVYSDPKFQSVWHGSPYSFEKFDSAHMGEGEGAQAHGWGHYVAVEEGTARHYAGMNESKTGGTDFKLDGKPYKEVYNTLSDFEKDAFDSFKAYRLNDYDFGEAWDRVIKNKTEEVNNGIKDMESSIKYGEEYLKKEQLTEDQTKRIKSLIENDKKRLEQYKSEKSELSKIDDLRKRSGVDNNLYEVEIPDPIKKDTPTGKNYLDEDEYLTKEQVRDIMNKAEEQKYGGLKPFEDADFDDVEKIANEVFSDLSEQQRKVSVQQFVDDVSDMVEFGDKTIPEAIDSELEYHTMLSSTMRDRKAKAGLYEKGKDYPATDGKGLYNELQYLLGGDKEASKFLESLGYDGIHYFGGRDGEAYVIFNDDALEITKHHKY